MEDGSKTTCTDPAAAAAPSRHARPYRSPRLVKRERLARITAEDSKLSGITVN